MKPCAHFEEEIDCISSIYSEGVNVVRNVDSILIECTMQFTNQRHVLCVLFTLHFEDNSMDISVENTKSAMEELDEDALSAIQSKLRTIHHEEAGNMPIFQCISFMFTELIDDGYLCSLDLGVDDKEKKKEKKVESAWWQTAGTRIEYKYKAKKWKNGVIARVYRSELGTRISIKFWKTPSLQKSAELTEQGLLELLRRKTLRESNLVYPLWVHTHSLIWILSKNQWKSGEIMHFLDDKQILIRFNGDNAKKPLSPQTLKNDCHGIADIVGG